MEDRLKQLFSEMMEVNCACNDEFKKLVGSGDKEMQKLWVNRYADAMIMECAELKEGAGWKWWKKHPDWTEENEHNLRIELVDILHFLVAGMQVLGMNDDDMWDLYLKKKELNMKRQREGYRDGSYKKIDENGKEDNYKLMK